ncbi:MAG: hypothetical protein PHO94_10770 [Petrimonas sp.]|nr:hypothetical protein [Petrimonas sp.]
MADLEQMKKGWKVLDENLQKSEIINHEQIKKIIMEKFETTIEKWQRRNILSLFTALVILIPFDINLFLKGFTLQAVLFLLVLIFLGVFSAMKIRQLHKWNIHETPPAKLMTQINTFRLKRKQFILYFMPFVLGFVIYVLSMNHVFDKYQWMGFATGLILGSVVVLIKQRKTYKDIQDNLKELVELQNEK